VEIHFFDFGTRDFETRDIDSESRSRSLVSN
jgi:hypothetical protein